MAIRLPRLQSQVPIVDTRGYPTLAFHQWWEAFAGEIENEVGALQAAELAQAAADTANAAAASANAAADAAQGAAANITASSALANSYTTGQTPQATDAGASATITIPAHTRVYGDGTSVAVSGGAVTGLAYSTRYWVYYDQASRLGGAVTYLAAVTIQGNGAGAPDRHFVGAVETPAALGAPIDGFQVVPPGGFSLF